MPEIEENTPKIIHIGPKTLMGMRVRTNMVQQNPAALWGRFMPRRKEIQHSLSPDLFSVQVYKVGLTFEDFNPQTPFDKWAAVEVSDQQNPLDGMEKLLLPAGKYALFLHRGLPQAFPQTLQYIFGQWLPVSGFQLDDRPQFEVMKPNYRPNDPAAEEEVWIPIK